MSNWTEIVVEIMDESETSVQVRVVDAVAGVWLPRALIEIGERACGLHLITAPSWLLANTGLV